MSDSNRPVGNCKHGFRHGLSCDACILQRRVDELQAELATAKRGAERCRDLLQRWVVDADSGCLSNVSLVLMVESEEALNPKEDSDES